MLPWIRGYAMDRIKTWVGHLRNDRRAALGLILLIALLVGAVGAPILSPHSPNDFFDGVRETPGTEGHPLGTDSVGRDLVTRLLYGARVSLLVGLGATILAAFVGFAVGAIAGYWGGWVDRGLMVVVEVFLSFPAILLAVALVAFMGPGLSSVVLALGAVGWTDFARLVRGEVLALKEREFVAAARAAGAGDLRLIVRHLFPHLAGPMVVMGSFALASAVLSEAALSFLGLGVSPPTPSWGSMLADGRGLMRVSPHLTWIPGLAITLAVLGFNLLGDGLRDFLDPRTRY